MFIPQVQCKTLSDVKNSHLNNQYLLKTLIPYSLQCGSCIHIFHFNRSDGIPLSGDNIYWYIFIKNIKNPEIILSIFFHILINSIINKPITNNKIKIFFNYKINREKSQKDFSDVFIYRNCFEIPIWQKKLSNIAQLYKNNIFVK